MLFKPAKVYVRLVLVVTTVVAFTVELFANLKVTFATLASLVILTFKRIDFPFWTVPFASVFRIKLNTGKR